jgi:hypothetical protein
MSTSLNLFLKIQLFDSHSGGGENLHKGPTQLVKKK